MFKGLGGLGDMAKMMGQAKEMQERMSQLQKDLASTPIHGESGAGLVKAIATGKGVLTGLDIDPSIFNAEEKEVVEDLILAAIKDAQDKAMAHQQAELQKLSQEFGFPADMKLPF
jgi:DNA-binding YbaB/EbfC family protein